MKNISQPEYDIDKNEEINLKEIFEIISNGKWILSSCMTIGFTFAIIYSLNLPDEYQSSALLFPAESSDSISSTLNNYSGIANLAGINLPSQANDSNSFKAIEKIQTLSFFRNNIMPNIILPELMAVKNWDNTTDEIIFDKDIYDSNKNKWIRPYSSPQKQIPSDQESYLVFINKHLDVTTDNQSGFIRISVKHQSPYISKRWVELLINEINNFYREKDRSMAKQSVDYLNAQIAETNFNEIKEVMAELLKQQIQKLTLIEANEYYVFDYIDPPVVSENKIGPKRLLICIIGWIIGSALGLILIMLNHIRKN
jgi:LPS O-antigen subunit length determinant protein (WzzB/FepE family)